MSASLGILMLAATMAAAEPNVTLNQLQENCEKLAAETFNRETADDEDRVDYRARYNDRRTSAFMRKLTYLPRLGALTCGFTCPIS